MINILDYINTPYSNHIKAFVKAHTEPVHPSILDKISKELN